MPDALKKPIFGLPRWAWLSILIAAIAIGLYLRHQKKAEEEAEGASGENVVAQPAGEIIEPPYEGFGPGGAEGSYGSEYAGGNELGLEREEQKEENQRLRESEKEENSLRQYELEHPPSGATAPSAQGAESFPAGAITGTEQIPLETKGKTATTGGGPPAKPAAATKSAKSVSGNAIGNAVAVSAPAQAATNAQGGTPENNAQHPAAVNTGNKCVNGGVGGHTAPSGYHLFCQGGWIWRAPNS
jgi:hypothetical protein